MPPEEVLIPKLKEVLYSGYVAEGPLVVQFERMFGEFIHWPHVLSVSSGTAGLHTALLLAGVERGDEVVSTALTAEPTNMVILQAGARVVWADIDVRNGNVSAASIRKRITPRTRAIMVVHYGGIPASIAEIRETARAAGVPVIEDAAHALGAKYGGHPVGSHSEYVVFSFQAIKHMTTVDGGMVSCRPEDLPTGRALRWFGIDRSRRRTDVDVVLAGYKYNMNDVTAALGLVQLQFISALIQRHIDNGKYFDRALRGIPGLDLCSWDEEAEPSYWFYTFLAEDRDGLGRRLAEHGVATSLVHRRNDWHSVFAESRCDLPNLDDFYSRVLHIPCGWWVAKEDREYIVDLLHQGW
jgi:dTDP-4-amino-4,6-dideoxygalactose transaminase